MQHLSIITHRMYTINEVVYHSLLLVLYSMLALVKRMLI